MSVENSARDIALRWIDLYNDGTPDSYGSERFLELYDEDLKWREMPTRAFPAGRTGSVGALREALAAGQAALRNRHVSLRELVAETDRFALTFSWQATVASDAFAFLGLSPGDTMKAPRVGTFSCPVIETRKYTLPIVQTIHHQMK